MKSGTNDWRSVVAVVSLVLGLMVPAISLAQVVFPPDATVFGMTYGQWSAAWWQYVLSIPISANPTFDATGQHCGVHQTGLVFFLAGEGDGKTVTRECTVPSDTPLFIPIINAECSNVEQPPFFGSTDAERLACAQDLIDGVSIGSLKATIDGVEVHGLRDFRVQSPPFDFTMPAQNNILYVSGETAGRSESDGYWLMLEPLSPGPHVLHFEGAVVSGPGKGFSQNVTYNLTVR
jgi:hypothetical protein